MQINGTNQIFSPIPPQRVAPAKIPLQNQASSISSKKPSEPCFSDIFLKTGIVIAISGLVIVVSLVHNAVKFGAPLVKASAAVYLPAVIGVAAGCLAVGALIIVIWAKYCPKPEAEKAPTKKITLTFPPLQILGPTQIPRPINLSVGTNKLYSGRVLHFLDTQTIHAFYPNHPLVSVVINIRDSDIIDSINAGYVDGVTITAKTFAHLAAEDGNLVIHRLLNKQPRQALYQKKDRSGDTALHYICRRKDYRKFFPLSLYTDTWQKKNRQGITPLHLAIATFKTRHLARVLKNHPQLKLTGRDLCLALSDPNAVEVEGKFQFFHQKGYSFEPKKDYLDRAGLREKYNEILFNKKRRASLYLLMTAHQFDTSGSAGLKIIPHDMFKEIWKHLQEK